MQAKEKSFYHIFRLCFFVPAFTILTVLNGVCVWLYPVGVNNSPTYWDTITGGLVMKRFVGCVAMVAVLVGFMSGCAKTKVTSEKTPFDIIQEKANAITAAGGLAAVGIGVSRTVHLALDKAKTRGRTELAHIMETKVDSLKKDFSEEIGAGDDSELNELFSAASKHIAHQILRGSVPKDLKYETKNNMTTAWALMVVDPKVVADAFASQKNTAKHMYTRFRASQAFKELDDEVKKFEEFKAKDAASMGM